MESKDPWRNVHSEFQGHTWKLTAVSFQKFVFRSLFISFFNRRPLWPRHLTAGTSHSAWCWRTSAGVKIDCSKFSEVCFQKFVYFVFRSEASVASTFDLRNFIFGMMSKNLSRSLHPKINALSEKLRPARPWQVFRSKKTPNFRQLLPNPKSESFAVLDSCFSHQHPSPHQVSSNSGQKRPRY